MTSAVPHVLISRAWQPLTCAFFFGGMKHVYSVMKEGGDISRYDQPTLSPLGTFAFLGLGPSQ